MSKPKDKTSRPKSNIIEPWSRGDLAAWAGVGLVVLGATGSGGYYFGSLKTRLTTQQVIVDLKNEKTVCEADLASRKSESSQISININGASSTTSFQGIVALGFAQGCLSWEIL